MPPIKERKRIAIVGSGVSGIAALWVKLRPSFPLSVDPGRRANPSTSSSLSYPRLCDTFPGLELRLDLRQALNEHSEHEVNIYEAGDYVGGHTHTVTFERASSVVVFTMIATRQVQNTDTMNYGRRSMLHRR